jgi:cell division transport system permease protein
MKTRKAANPQTIVAKIRQLHGKDVRSSLARIRSTPFSSFMTVFVIAVALLLPALLFSFKSNFDSVLGGFQSNAQFTLYLKQNLNESDGIRVSNDLLQEQGVNSTRFISADQALLEFTAGSGFAGIIESLETNPLPATIVVVPTAAAVENIDALAQRLLALPEVELVQIDSQWLQRLAAMSALLAALIRSLSAIVIIGLFFIVGNTIKLSVENRKDEIRVIKLVGGTNGFIARPFLYAGLFYGLCGGLLAWILQLAVFAGFSGPLRELTGLFESSFELSGMGPGGTLGLVLAGGTIGWIAALLASHRYIAQIEP